MNKNKFANNINDNIKVDLVSGDQMTEEDRASVFNRESTIDAIPDLDILTGQVLEILEYLERPSTKRLMKTNEGAVKMNLNNKYADTKIPLGIITLLMEENNREENVERMLKMFESLQQAKKGEITLESAEQTLSSDINERYLYSEYGSKEAFEKAIQSEIKKEQKKKNNIGAPELNIGKVKIKK